MEKEDKLPKCRIIHSRQMAHILVYAARLSWGGVGVCVCVTGGGSSETISAFAEELKMRWSESSGRNDSL